MTFSKKNYLDKLIAGRYLTTKFLNEGGFGAVYEGDHLIFGEKIRNVAIKIIKSPISRGKEKEIFSEAILQMKIEAEIKNLSIREKLVRIYDFGIIDDSERLGYIVMEFINGGDLQTEFEKFGKKMPANIAQGYIVEVSETMAALHSLNPPLLHSDIKPENTLLTENKKVKIVDFGLAVRINKLYNWATGVSGTSTFMASETLTNVSFTQSDVFSIGVMWYYLLTGYMPFDDQYPPSGIKEQDAAMWRYNRRKNMIPPDPRKYCNTCPDKTANIINKCLSFNYKERYKDAGELLAYIKADLLSREEYLKLARADNNNKQYLAAMLNVDKALQLPRRYDDRIHFLLKLERTFALMSEGSSNNISMASQLFIEHRNEDARCKWLNNMEKRNLYEKEIALCNKKDAPRTRLLQNLIKDLDKKINESKR